MSIDGHDRRLARLAKEGRAQDNSLVSVVYAVEREHRRRRAALALVAVAQALTGTEPPLPEPVHDEPPPPHAGPFAAPPPRSRGPVWGGNNRPGPHDMLTWEEAMRIPWLDENAVSDP